jgi:hypothetical protein
VNNALIVSVCKFEDATDITDLRTVMVIDNYYAYFSRKLLMKKKMVHVICQFPTAVGARPIKGF